MTKKDRTCFCCRSMVHTPVAPDNRYWCPRCLDVCSLYDSPEEKDRLHNRPRDFTPGTVPDEAVEIVQKRLGTEVATEEALRAMLAELLNVSNREARRAAYRDMARILDIDILELQGRTRNTLRANGINTVWDLILRSRKDLWSMGGMGLTGENQIREKLREKFELTMSPRPYNPRKSYMPRVGRNKV